MEVLSTNGESDADVYLILNNSELSKLCPNDIIEKIEKMFNGNRSDIEEVKKSRRAVTLKFLEGDVIQLVPVIDIYDGYKISDGTDWVDIKPFKHSERLTEVNQNCKGKVIPTAKIAKKLPEFQQMNGYHIESMAIEAFKTCPEDIRKTPKAMLRHFVEKSTDIIKSPIKDRSGQSIYVDEYLGEENSAERAKISYSLDILNRKTKNADDVGSVDEWASILGIDRSR